MSIPTYKHCIFCYKLDTSSATVGDDNGTNATADGSDDCNSLHKMNKNAETATRFCTLSGRYLKLKSDRFIYERTLYSKFRINMTAICDRCQELASSFCAIYEQVQLLQLQMDWRLQELSRVMQYAESAPEHLADRQVLCDKLVRMMSKPESIDKYRKDFLTAVDKRKKRSGPKLQSKQLKLEEFEFVEDRDTEEDELSETDSDDDIFIPIKPVRVAPLPVPTPKKRKRATTGRKIPSKDKLKESSGLSSSSSSGIGSSCQDKNTHDFKSVTEDSQDEDLSLDANNVELNDSLESRESNSPEHVNSKEVEGGETKKNEVKPVSVSSSPGITREKAKETVITFGKALSLFNCLKNQSRSRLSDEFENSKVST